MCVNPYAHRWHSKWCNCVVRGTSGVWCAIKALEVDVGIVGVSFVIGSVVRVLEDPCLSLKGCLCPREPSLGFEVP